MPNKASKARWFVMGFALKGCLMKWLVSTLFLFAAGFAGQAAAAGTVALKSAVEKEIQTTNAQGEKVLKRVEVKKALPGEVLIYTVSYANNSGKPAEKVAINNPVPEHMVYVADSALSANATVTYSLDRGKSFAEPEQLKVRKPDGSERPAAAADYSDIRWVLKKPVQPGETGSVSFRAQLK